MTAKRQRSILGCAMGLLMGVALWTVPAPSQAASVTQLDITGGSINLNFGQLGSCLLYTSDAADERSSVDLGGRRIIKKKQSNTDTGTVVHNTQQTTR